MKSTKKIVFRSAPGAFAVVLLQAEKLADRFRSTNLDFAIRKAITDGLLFVMPDGLKFAYCRGTGPVGLGKVRLGRHEKNDASGSPDWNSPRMLVASYSLSLVDDEDSDNNRKVTVDITIPTRFTDLYVERSEGISHNPTLTRLEFTYDEKDLKVWIRQRQMEIYADAEHEIHRQISHLTKVAAEINKNSRKTKPDVPHQSGY
jgi:hypothetical protein